MANFGGVLTSKIIGTQKPQAERSELWAIAGIDGYGIQLLGKADGRYRVTLIQFANGAALDFWYEAVLSLQGTLATFTNDFGITSAPAFVENVGQLRKTLAIDQNNGTTVRGQVEVSMVAQQ